MRSFHFFNFFVVKYLFFFYKTYILSKAIELMSWKCSMQKDVVCQAILNAS